MRGVLRGYSAPHTRRSVLELLVTAIPFATTWILLWYTLSAGYWAGFALAVPAAAFLVRLFMIQHDCGHRSFFASQRANDWVGRAIGVLTLTPHDFWRHTHNTHHATSGNLDRPYIGGVDTLTVREYQSLPRWQRWRYRLYRHPIVLFGIGPAWVFLLDYRLPVGFMRVGWKPWASTMATNAVIVALWGGLMVAVGVSTFLLVQLPITLLAASIGVWLFYVQHQFEDTYWAHEEDWTFDESALHGSSHYVLPGLLRWFSANIGVHHLHHLCCRIPSYRLSEVLRDHPELANISRISLRQSVAAVRLALWDEDKRRLVSFREARRDSIRAQKHIRQYVEPID
nr:fatty acid desaturase [Methylohalomonas lacus]